MRNFGKPEIRAAEIPNYEHQSGQTIPFRNVNANVYSKSENESNSQKENVDNESDSDEDNNIDKFYEIGDIVGTFSNYPNVFTLNHLFDQIIDNYNSYPIYGSSNYKNNATEKIQRIASKLLSTNNKNEDSINSKQNDEKKPENFEWLTYGEFGELVKATATGFITTGEFSTQIGVDGEFVGILLENSIYYPLAQWACAYIGAVIIPIDISYPSEIILSIIQTFKCSSLICSIDTFKNHIQKLFPVDDPGKLTKVFLFCEDDDLNQLSIDYQDKFNENYNKTIEQVISEDIRLKFFTLPQIILPQVNPPPRAKNSENLTKKGNKNDEDFPDVEIDNEADYLTNNNVFSRLPRIQPDTLCALNTGTGRCGSLKQCYLTHYNMIAAASGVESCGYKLGRDVYMSNVPMYRVFERSLQLSIISNGGCIGFINEKDLKKMNDEKNEEGKKVKNQTEKNKGGTKIYSKNEVEEDDDEENKTDYETLFEALKLLRPTILVLTGDAVKSISDGLICNITKQNIFKRMFFDLTLKIAEQARESFSQIPWITKTLVIDDYRKLVGGRLRLIISTSRYLNAQVQHNIRTILQIPVIQMYGVAEAGGICCIQHIEDKDVMDVGAPTTTCEIRLRNFFSACTNVNNGDQGEILVKGPGLFKCYYKNDDLTKKNLTDEGWFATGDLGRITPNGTLQVIDTIMDFNRRRKEIYERDYHKY